MNTDEDLDRIRSLDGIFVGLLSPDELDALDRLEKLGLAQRVYGGPAGFLGLARVAVVLDEEVAA